MFTSSTSFFTSPGRAWVPNNCLGKVKLKETKYLLSGYHSGITKIIIQGICSHDKNSVYVFFLLTKPLTLSNPQDFILPKQYLLMATIAKSRWPCLFIHLIIETRVLTSSYIFLFKHFIFWEFHTSALCSHHFHTSLFPIHRSCFEPPSN